VVWQGSGFMKFQTNAQNAPELFLQPDVDGGLIGGASLKAEDFVAIVNAMK
jgi:triosephosphate isomerase